MRLLDRALRLFAILVLLGAALSPRAQGDNIALNFSDYAGVGYGPSLVAGWEFDVLNPIEITGLGMFEYDTLHADGHEVGIYNSSGTLLASATVMPSDPKTGFFRFTSLVTPITLSPGSGYRIAAASREEFYAYGLTDPPTGFVVDSRLRYVQNRYADSNVLKNPNYVDPNTAYGWWGPNMLLRDPAGDPVPEPAFLQLPVLAGLGGLAWWRRRRTA